MNRPSLVTPPDPIEQKYALALDEIQGRIVQNPLFEKSLETPRDAAILLDKIVRFFYYENTDYLTEDIDYKNPMLEALSELHAFLSKGSIESIYSMYSNFVASGDISREMLYEKAKELFATIGKNDLPKFLKVLFSPFETLAGYREENFHGSKSLQEFSAYARVFGRGLLYPEHRVAGIVRPAEGATALTSLLEQEPDVTNIIGRISKEAHGVATGAPTPPGSNVIALSGSNRNGTTPGATPIASGAGLEGIPEDVEAIVSGNEHSQNSPEKPNSDAGEGESSEAVTGRLRRREKDRGIRIEKEATRLEQKNQEWYTNELERLRALNSFLHERFEELRNHLLENVPYVGEVFDYLSLTADLEERGYEVDSTAFNEIKEEQKRRIKLLEQLIEQCEVEYSKLGTEMEQLQVELSQIHDDSGVTQIAKKITKKQRKILKNRGNISLYNAEIKKEKRGIGSLINRARSHRLNEVPNSEQFAQAFHYSLRAEELYSAPEYHPETLVSRKWIHDNIIPLFVSIIGTHLDEYHGVNTRDLYELMVKIDDLPEQFSEEIELPDTEDVSQRRVNDFFEMLIPLIPQDYLETLPKLPVVVTPEGVYHAEPQKTKAPKVRKSHREIREMGSVRKAELEGKKSGLIADIELVETKLKEYEQYWREKLRLNIKARMTYTSDIEKIRKGIKRTRSHPTKSIEDLDALIVSSRSEEQELSAKIEEGRLKNDEAEYKGLLDKRVQISRKLARLK